MIQENILELVKYGLSTGLVDPEDKVYTINRLLELFQVDEIEDAVFEKVENLPAWTQEEAEGKLEGILAEMMDYAYENGLMAENSIVYKDLFDTKIMGCHQSVQTGERSKSHCGSKKCKAERVSEVPAL